MKISSDLPKDATLQRNIVFDFDKFTFRFMETTLWSFANSQKDIDYNREHYGKFLLNIQDINNVSYYYHNMIIYTFRKIK